LTRAGTRPVAIRPVPFSGRAQGALPDCGSIPRIAGRSRLLQNHCRRGLSPDRSEKNSAHVGKSVVPDRGTVILPVKSGTDTGWKPVPPPDSPHEPRFFHRLAAYRRAARGAKSVVGVGLRCDGSGRFQPGSNAKESRCRLRKVLSGAGRWDSAPGSGRPLSPPSREEERRGAPGSALATPARS
jgi:hypothetical protein